MEEFLLEQKIVIEYDSEVIIGHYMKKNSRLSSSLLLTLLILSILIVSILVKSFKTIESLKDVSVSMNKTLPRIINDNISLVTTKAEGKIFTYIYNIVPDQRTAPKNVKKDALDFICTDKFSLAALNDNATFKYTYLNKKNDLVYSYQIIIKDCK
jgi:hypothetical protein